MIKIISHRGNIDGPIPNKENRPSYIDCALSSGYNVEVDIRCIDGKYWLGHDTPDYQVNLEWINKRKDNIWFHCKDLESSSKFTSLDAICFCHTSDPYVLVNNSYIWVHDLTMKLDENCIIPLINQFDIINFNNKFVYGICTDYVTFCKYNLKTKGLL